MFTYELPSELIAQYPSEPRDTARLLVLNRANGDITHHIFRELPQFLRAGDCLVLNDTKVIPARLYGKSEETGGRVELLLLKSEKGSSYRCLGQPGKRLKLGAKLLFGARHHLKAKVISVDGSERTIQFSSIKGGGMADVGQILSDLAEIPLPPYIHRSVQPEDSRWYQTVFARETGAVAAPTAGFHFTQLLLEQIRTMGVHIVFITLHVGWGTFKPVGEKELQTGTLHEEQFQIPSETIKTIHETKSNGGRVIAVGTTVVRTLETWAARGGVVEGLTGLFIRPPFQFQVIDAMVTNFHLPGTSLLLLVLAFAGEERIRAAYEEVVRQKYRFYSYGDAMLIL